MAEYGRTIESLEARIEAMRAEHAAEIAEHDERIRRLEADSEAMGDDNKKLAASDRYHNNPHSPPRSGTWAAEYRRRRAIEVLHARHPAWRPPGRSVGHQGVTRKLETNRPDEHRVPTECPGCRCTDLTEAGTSTKQVAELERIVVSRKNIIFHDMSCNGCGAEVRASRKGTVKNAWFGPRMLSTLWNVHVGARCSASTIAKVATHVMASGRAGREESGPWRLLTTCWPSRPTRYAKRWTRCATSARSTSACARWPSTTAAARAARARARRPSRPAGRRRRRVRRGYIHAAHDNRGNVNVWANPSRGVKVLLDHLSDRVHAGTAADRLPNYDRCAVRQNDHAHELRESEAAAMTSNPAAVRLHEMFGSVLAAVRGYAAAHLGGAFPEPGAAAAAASSRSAYSASPMPTRRKGTSAWARGSASRPPALSSATSTPT